MLDNREHSLETKQCQLVEVVASVNLLRWELLRESCRIRF